jgi:hypothetical protein
MNSYVYALWRNGNTLYAGGNFSSAGGTTRNYLASFNASSGALNSWNPNANSSVYAITASSDTVYMGGNFSQINSVNRTRMAAVRTGAGTTLLPFNQSPNNVVRNMIITDKVLLAGGAFTLIGGKSRGGFAIYKLPGNSHFNWTNDNNAIAENSSMEKLADDAVNSFIVYPNPARATVHLKFAHTINSDAVIIITDMGGNKVLQQKLQGHFSGDFQINIAGLKSGSYVVTVYTGNAVVKGALVKVD